MLVKGEDHEENVTVDTPPPQPVEPPQAALSQTTVNTDQVAIPVELIQADADMVASSLTANQHLCTVISPATLAGGYTFPAQVDGIDFIVTVPTGGVVEGQAFTVPYPTAAAVQPLSVELVTPDVVMMTPEEEVKGRWRNELCECCEVFANGMCLQGFFCAPILLAQVMTRFHLNPLGSYGPLRYRQTFWWILTIWIVFLAIACFLWTSGNVAFLFEILFIAFFVVVSTRVRSRMRRRYEMPLECCEGCDALGDCCCVFWCCPCSAIQMARHTHDTDTYPYHCCTTTGLSKDAPQLVV